MKAFTLTAVPPRPHYNCLSPVQALGIVLACAIVIGCGSLILPFG